VTASRRTAPPANYRFLRYLAPNAVTAASLVFGMVSMVAAHQGRFDLAGWMIIYAVLTDRLDGMVARMVRGTSDFGVQLDSFADFLNFGIAPAFLLFSFFDAHPQLGFGDGAARVLLAAACIAWVMGAVFRLARFNVASEDGVPTKIFFGVPTTLAGGLLIIWFLALLKYGGELGVPGGFGGARLLGDEVTTPLDVWKWFPVAMLLGAFLMASNLRMLKVGTTARRATTVFVLVIVASGYVLGFARLYPEYLVVPPSAWIVVFLIWGQTSAKARGFAPPPLFPRAEADDGMVRMRPQEDLAPEDDAV
jgi:CDP-diacylglycerol---serine O-phosphatidyltransferase